MTEIFTEAGINYLKENGPIGCRDYSTVKHLEEKEVPCYFSGCLTLTLENHYTERDDIIYCVDIPKE